jgi:Fe-S-cluster containining protein
MSELCLACGLCCSGVLFRTVEVRPEELDLVPASTLKVHRGERKLQFTLPCPAHDGDRCTVYEQRPAICRTYECGVLRDYRAGRIDLPRARQIVDETKAQTRALAARLPPSENGESLAFLLKDLAEQTRDHLASHPASAEVLLDGLLLVQQVRKHFVRRPPKAGPGAAPEPGKPT